MSHRHCEGDKVQVLWRESDDYFAGTVQRVSETSDGQVVYDVLYEERVRGKVVTENNDTADRLGLSRSIPVCHGIMERIYSMVTLSHSTATTMDERLFRGKWHLMMLKL